MSVEAQWREHHLRRRRLMMMGWGLTLAMLVSLLGFVVIGP